MAEHTADKLLESRAVVLYRHDNYCILKYKHYDDIHVRNVKARKPVHLHSEYQL